MIALLFAFHMGKLHAYEHVLVYLLAFGPFLLVAVSIRISRRRNLEEQPDEPADQQVDRAGDQERRVHDSR